jgi:glycine/sarcosine/betaine reductase complex component A
MGLEDQAAVKRVAEEQGSAVVLLGTPDVESTRTLGETVVTGDPSFAGPLAGVPLGLPVVHIFEPAIKAQVPPAVYETQVGLMELSLDAPGIVAALAGVRATGAGAPE